MLSLKTALERRGRVWWVAPSFSQSSMAWRELKALAHQIPGKVIREDARRIALPRGGEITVKSADAPDALRGEGLDLVVLDEAAFIDEVVWTDALRPSLSDRKGGALIISTPRGFDWFYEAWQRGQDGLDDWMSWQYPTADNPLIDPAEIEAARGSLSSHTFSQEYLALFVSREGGMFKRSDLPYVAAAPALGRRVRYWDLGGSDSSEADYTAGLLMNAAPDGLFYIEDMQRGQWSPRERNERIRSTAANDKADYGHVETWIERVPGLAVEVIDTIVRALAGFSVRTEMAHRDKVTRADPLAGQAEAGNVRIVRGSWNCAFLDEAADFPSGLHDDQIDAASGAFNKLVRAPVSVKKPPSIMNRWNEVGSVTPTQRGTNRWKL